MSNTKDLPTLQSAWEKGSTLVLSHHMHGGSTVLRVVVDTGTYDCLRYMRFAGDVWTVSFDHRNVDAGAVFAWLQENL